MIVTKRIRNIIRSIGDEQAFPITEAEALRYRLVGKKTIAVMRKCGLIKPLAPIVIRPQPSHPLHAIDPVLAAQLAARSIWTTDDAERAVKGRRLQPHGGMIRNLGRTRYATILNWIGQSGWTKRQP